MDTTSISFRWNLAYADAYTDLLWEKNIVRLLKSTAEVVLKNRTIIVSLKSTAKVVTKNDTNIDSYLQSDS